MSTADRDALPLKQPKDTVITIDPSGKMRPKHEYWDGSGWVQAAKHAAPERGESNLIVAPTTAGWRVELGDPSYPVRYWDGTSYRFRLDNAGTVEAAAFASRAVSDPNNAFTAYSSTGDDVVRIRTRTGGTKADIEVDGGSIRLYGTPPYTAEKASLGITSGSNAGFLSLTNGGLATLLTAVADETVKVGGTFRFLTETVDTQPRVQISHLTAEILLGSGSATPDIRVFRDAANVLRLDDGDSFRWANDVAQGQLDNQGFIQLTERGTDPGTPSANKVRLYSFDSSGVSRLKAIDDGGAASLLAGISYAQTWGATQTFTALQEFERAAANNDAIRTRVIGDSNPRLAIQAEGEHELGSGSAAADVFWNRGGVNIFEIGKSGTGNAIQGWEMTPPSAPAANAGRLYFEDNGSGKTRLMALFNTGAAQQIAIEP